MQHTQMSTQDQSINFIFRSFHFQKTDKMPSLVDLATEIVFMM